MSHTNHADGGPAFPRNGYFPHLADIDGRFHTERLASITTPQPGMTLREWYAGLLLAALIVADGNDTGMWEGTDPRTYLAGGVATRYAALATGMADQLLTALGHHVAPSIQDCENRSPNVPRAGGDL